MPSWILFLLLGISGLALSVEAQAQDYSGNLFDTHLHFEELEADSITPRLSTHDVKGAVTFVDIAFSANSESPDTVEDVEDLVSDHPDLFVPFFNCDCDSTDDLTASIVESILTEGSQVLFGFGEVALYDDPWSPAGTDPNEEPFLSVYPVLSDRGKWVMFHITPTQEEALNQVLGQFPNQKFLFHGYAAKNYISRILSAHSNAYLTIDNAALLTRPGEDEADTLLYASDITGASDFLAAYERESTTLMNNAVSIYKPIIEANPNQVLWGTDVSTDWHVDEEVYRKLIEFSRSFIGQLDPSVQEKYAVTNAQGLWTPAAAVSTEDEEGEESGSSGGGCSLIQR